LTLEPVLRRSIDVLMLTLRSAIVVADHIAFRLIADIIHPRPKLSTIRPMNAIFAPKL